MEIIVAIIGLIAAIIGRKKIIEYRHTYNSSSQYNHWYDNHFWIFISLILFFPLGFYALYQSNTVAKGWKWFWFIFYSLFVLSLLSK